jgi:ATP-dependent Clp protease ATP-binding subunit ClpC
MFERYTEKARRTIFFGRYEATMAGSDRIEPQHLLLGSIRENKSLWARVAGEKLQEIVAAVRLVIAEERGGRAETSGDIPLSSMGKLAVAAAAEQPETRPSESIIDATHQLLGILQHCGDSEVFEVLRQNDITYERARAILFDPMPYLTKALRQGDSRLNLSGMSLAEVPTILSDFVQLRELDLSGNQLSELPHFLAIYST